MRSIRALLGAILTLLVPGLAAAQLLTLGAGPSGAGGGSQQPAPTPSPANFYGTFFGYDQQAFGGTSNNGLTLSAGATFVPGGQNPWVAVVKFRYDDTVGTQPTGTAPATILASCASSACSSGNDRNLQISNPNNATHAREVLFQGRRSGATLWGGTNGDTGIVLVPGKYYCAVVAQYTTGAMSVSVNDNTGSAASGSPSLQAGPNNTPSPGATNYYYNTGSSTPITPTALGNLFSQVGTAFTATTAYENGSTGPIGDIAMLTGTLANTSGTPTASVLANLCNGSQTLAQWATANSLTITSHYPLNNPNASPPTSFPADVAGTFTTAATVFGTTTANIIPASPLTPLPCLTLNEKGPFDVAPLDAGQAGTGNGTVRVSGTISAASCGFSPSGVQAQIVSIATGSPVVGWTNLTLSGTTFSGFLDGVPGSTSANGCYTQQVRLTNSTSYVLAGQFPICVGFSYIRWGQSQVVFMTSPGSTGAGTGSNLAGNGVLTELVMPLTDVGNVPTNHGAGHPGMIRIDAVNNPGGGSANQIAGDGIVEEAQDLSAALSGVPVKVISIAKSGNASDSWAEDYQPQSQALTGAGAGAYSTASLFSSAVPTGAGGALSYVGSLGSVNTAAGPQMSVLLGSLIIRDSTGAVVATDPSTTCTDPCSIQSAGAATVTAGTISHVTGAIAGLTFSASQSSPLTASWTEISDTAAASYLQQVPYIGFPTWGDSVHSSSGYVTQVLNEVFQPPSAEVGEQCTADQSSLASNSPPATNASGYPLAFQTKTNFYLVTRVSAWPWYRSGTPVMVFGYGRDVGDTGTGIAGCRQALIAMQSAFSNYVNGGSYYDDLVQCVGSVILCFSPHEGPYVLGGRRFARRAAARLVAMQTGTLSSVAEPSITGGVRSGTTITITINLPNGGAITTCGANLSNGSNTPQVSTNTCSPPGTPVGTPCYGFKVGFATNAMFNWEGVNESANPYTVDDTKQFTCTIASATTVSLTGAWFTSGLFWSYAADAPIAEAGTAKTLTVVGGSLYTGTASTVTGTGATNASGGTCVHATVSIPLLAAAPITATRTTVGSQCVGTDTFSLAHWTGGTGGSVSAAFWQQQDDFNRVGQLLYDNTGGCGGTQSGTVYEPGCLVQAQPIPQGPLS